MTIDPNTQLILPQSTPPKKLNGAPFGVQSERFSITGVHPKRLVPGSFIGSATATQSTSSAIGPGSYDISQRDAFSDTTLNAKRNFPGWQRQQEVEKLAKIPHLLYRDQWEQRKLLATKRGPGTYEYKDFLEEGDKPRSNLGIITTLSSRFRDAKAYDLVPGPGAYGEHGIPHTRKEERDKISYSNVGMLDAKASFPRNLPMVGCHVPPGSYEYKSFTQELLNKRVGLRGPYEVFTVDRNKPMITGHYAKQKTTNLGPGQYTYKSGVETFLNNPHKQKHGRFGRHSQYPLKPTERIYITAKTQVPQETDFPGPGSYDPNMPHDWPKPTTQQADVQFLSKAKRDDRRAQKFFTRNFNPVGAGRYDLHKWEEIRYVDGHTNNFKSRTDRNITLAKEKALRERLKSHNIPVEARQKLIPDSQPSNKCIAVQ